MTLWIQTYGMDVKEVQNGHFLLCPNGITCTIQKIYFKGLIEFLRDVDKGTFKRVII
jgi:proline iminopeptidase